MSRSSAPSTQPLRVLIVARRSAPATGGIESYLQHLSRGLAKHHEVTILARQVSEWPEDRLTDSLRPPPSFAPFDDAGVRITPLQFNRARRLSMAPTAVQVIPGIRRYAFGRMRIPIATWYAHSAAPIIARQAADADVIHVWGDGFLAIAGVAAARRVGAPVLITPFIHKGQWGDDPASALAYRRADRVIGLLDYDCQVIRGLGPADARVVECPVCSPGVARGGGRAWRQRHGVYGPLIVFLGVRRAYKGFDLLLSALPELGRRVPRATVVFAGPGESIGGDHPVRVIDRGRVSDEERAALLDAGDALCLPSAGEIFPVTILEAWSAETAVLTSDIPPLRELMRRSGGGIAVPRDSAAIADGLAAILNDGERRYATAGHRYWRTNATVEAVVNRHVDLYRSTISAAGALGSAG